MGLIDRDYMHEDRSKRAAYNPKNHRSAPTNAQFWNNVRRGGAWTLSPALVFLVLVCVVVLISFQLWGLPNLSAFRAATNVLPHPARLVTLPQPFPEPGSARYYQPVDRAQLVSSAKVIVQPGSDSYKHVLRVIRVADQSIFVDLYLVAGQTVDFALPPGQFIVQSFVGEVWYGPDMMFGPDFPPSPLPGVMTSTAGAEFGFSLGSPKLLTRSRM